MFQKNDKSEGETMKTITVQVAEFLATTTGQQLITAAAGYAIRWLQVATRPAGHARRLRKRSTDKDQTPPG
jgi:hypothetical protein